MPQGPEQPGTPRSPLTPDGQQERKGEISSASDVHRITNLTEAEEELRKQLTPDSATDVAALESNAKLKAAIASLQVERSRRGGRNGLTQGMLEWCQGHNAPIKNITMSDGGDEIAVEFRPGTEPDIAALDKIIAQFEEQGIHMHYSLGAGFRLTVDGAFWAPRQAGSDTQMQSGLQARIAFIGWLSGTTPLEEPPHTTVTQTQDTSDLRLHGPLNPLEKPAKEHTRLKEEQDAAKKKKEAFIRPYDPDATKKLRESLEVLQSSDKVIFNESLWKRDPADGRWKTSNEDIVLAGGHTHTSDVMQGHVDGGAAVRLAAEELPLLEKAEKARTMRGMTVLSRPNASGIFSEYVCNEQAHKFKKLEFQERWRTVNIDTNGASGAFMMNLSGNWKSPMQLPGGGQLGAMWENTTSANGQFKFQRRSYGFDVSAEPGARPGPHTINIWGQTLTINVLSVTPGPARILMGQRLPFQPNRATVAAGPGTVQSRINATKEEISNPTAGGGAVEIVTNASGDKTVIGKRPGPVELLTNGQRHIITVSECPESMGYLHTEIEQGGRDYTIAQPSYRPLTLISPTGARETLAFGETKTIDGVTFERRNAAAGDGTYDWFEVRVGLTATVGSAWSAEFSPATRRSFRVIERRAVTPAPATASSAPSAPSAVTRPATTPSTPEAPRVPEWRTDRARLNPADFESAAPANSYCFVLQGGAIRTLRKIGEGAGIRGWSSDLDPTHTDPPLEYRNHDAVRADGLALFAPSLAGNIRTPAEGTSITGQDGYSQWTYRRFRVGGAEELRWGRTR